MPATFLKYDLWMPGAIEEPEEPQVPEQKVFLLVEMPKKGPIGDLQVKN